MKKLLLTLAAAFLLLPAGAEKIIGTHKDTVLSTETQKGGVVNKAFYVFKPAQNYRGKKVIFRMNAKRIEGNSDLGVTFRCSTNPGNQLRVAQNFKVAYKKNGETVPVEFVLDIPDLDNIHHFNMHAGFRRMGSAKCVWELSKIRFVEYDDKKASAAPAKKAEDEGFAAQLTASMVSKPLTLIKNGKSCFVIVTADKPNRIAQYAAAELQKHFKLVCGDAPKIIGESKYKSGPAIMVGETAIAKKYGINPELLAPENLMVARLGDVIVLSGGDNATIPGGMVAGRSFVPVGTLYATYEFLERVVGIRWYWPGKNGTYIPVRKNLSVNKLFVTSRPQYDTRKTFYSIVRNDPDVTHWDCEQWYRRNRFGGSLGDPVANHSFNDWIKRFAKTKPEYLALQADGSRKTNPEPGGGHVCMSHPEVFAQTVADKLAEFKKSTYSSFAKVMPGDSNGLFYCKCGPCQKKIRPDMGDRGLYSNVVWSYVNRVAAEVAKKMPGKNIVCCAYGGYLRKPEFPLMPNVAVTLCFYPVPRASLAYKKMWKELLDEWSSTGAKLYVWEYWNGSRYGRGVYGTPAIYPRQLKEIYAMDAGRISGRAIEMPDVNGDGKPVSGWADWIYDVQNLYVAGRLMWNPAADIDTVLDEYYTNFFGPAAAPIRQFHEEMELAWVRKGQQAGGMWNFQRVWKELYPPEFVDRMMGLLQQAVKLAGKQEPYAYRTRKLLNGYKPFDQNSRLFRGGNRKTNPFNVTVPKVAGKPVEADWKKALELKDFCDSYNVYRQDSETSMRLLHDGKNIYIKANCFIPKGVAGVTWAKPDTGKRDGALWNYESLEFFLAQGNESYQFILAPDNCLLDAFNQTQKGSPKAMTWNSKKVQWSTVRKGIYWEGMLTIPLDEMKFSAKGKPGVFRFNAYRNCRYNMPGEPEKWEQSCYLPTFGGFHNIERFGTLRLGK